jgi:hypothetical protein
MIKLISLFIILNLSACAAPYTKADISNEEKKQDILDCKLEASKVSGYDAVDKAINQGNVKRACLEAKGYTRNGTH